MNNWLFKFLFVHFFSFGFLLSMSHQPDETESYCIYERCDPNSICFLEKESALNDCFILSAIRSDSLELFINMIKNNPNLLDRDILVAHKIIKVISYICMYGSFKILQFVLANGICANYMDKNGKTLLHFALSSGENEKKLQTIKILLEHGANVNALTEDIYSNSPLHLALFYGSSDEVIEELFKAGAEPNVMNFNGMGPVCFVNNYNQLSLFLKYKAHIDIVSLWRLRQDKIIE